MERAEHAVDPIARIAKDPPHAPFVQAFDDEITDALAHCRSPLDFRRSFGWIRASILHARTRGPVVRSCSAPSAAGRIEQGRRRC